MCDQVPRSEWVPFHFLNLNYLHMVEKSPPVYAVLEYCPACKDTQARRLDPTSIEIVDETDLSHSPDEPDEQPWAGEQDGRTGLDLEHPSDA